MILNMWSRCFLAFLASGILLFAQTQMSVEQLADFIRSELALHQHSDKQIAAGVRDIQLNEKLTDKTIIDLQAQGAGPKTVDALKALRDKTATMKPPAHDATSSPATAGEQSAESVGAAPQAPAVPPPSAAKQKEILQAIKDYARNYTKRLPNFFCVEVTRQYVDPNGAQNYRNAGTILAKVGYNEGQEHYNVYSVNGKLVDTTMEQLKSGSTSTGEFYTLMKSVFAPESETEFKWDHWAKLRGRVMAVFSYFVDTPQGSFEISSGDGASEQHIRVAQRGLVYADPSTGEIDRIRMEAANIPKSFPISSTSEVLDYEMVTISGQQFVLPLTAKLFMKGGRESTKNEIEFRAYRKFEADTFIKYDLDPNAPPPLPESKTQESPATGGEQTKPIEQAPPEPPKRKPSPFVLPRTEDLPPPPPR